MVKQHNAGSASLPKLITAFGGLFVIFVASFEPTTALLYALSATVFLSRL
ncbi:TPA: hypothetical protein ACQYFN_000546 [Vibrio parahaemolyticus]|nr:hypothetical protein [Vibrio parahaemolyticus]MBE5175873.1 hypothetical protein [Vibrio parahaemolyticus]HCE4545000.1 hypothetical protein [Vibrio parahaemolyticus]HCG5592896.1 hypothetical protein [Vibrio parahaemolyticus]HCG6276347.1 hypothetical protein [Vibrio parahaemolyticus]HCG6280104.1 hypothetical protein [Vibrio parahaemolyticus]